MEDNNSLPSLIKNIIENNEPSILLNPTMFEHSQRVANMLTKSTMVPKIFQNNIGNCVIALNLAYRMKLDPFMVMQKMYVVHGKPGIESQLAIAVINSSGKFTPIQYKLSANKQECYAYAKNKATGELCNGPIVTIEMAKKEGWYNKDGSKWKTMPELMLHYRSAMFFGRLYCPEALLGMELKDEIEDYGENIIRCKTEAEAEIEENANHEIIDIQPQNDMAPVEDDQDFFSEEEKEEIIKQEIAEAEANQSGPGF